MTIRRFAVRSNFFKDVKLQHKLLFSYILLMTLPIVIIAIVVYYSFTQVITEEMKQSNIESLEQICTNMDASLKEIDRLYIPIITNEHLKSIFEQKQVSEIEVLLYNKKFIDTIYPTIFEARGNQISSVYFFGTNGVNLVYRTDAIVHGDTFNNILKINNKVLEENAIYKEAQIAKGRGIWIKTHEDRFFYENNSPLVLTYARKILSLSDFKDWGLLMVNLSETWVNSIYSHSQYGKKGYIFITDTTGNIISHSSKSEIGKSVNDSIKGILGSNDEASSIIDFNSQKYMLNIVSSSYVGWRIISMIPVKEFYKKVDIVRFTIILVLIVCAIFAIMLSIVFSRSISLPIKKLVKQMLEVEKGNLDVSVTTNSTDEIGTLSKSFNKMVYQLKELIKSLTEKERKLRVSELKALQAQINPHFLYNTLDSIYWMTKTREYDNIARMTTSLAKLFRLSLNKGNEKTLIKNEIEHVENYLNIQKLRYKDKFNYSIIYDDDILGYETIKLILQPLVENSLLHGFEYKEGTGNITICARTDSGIIKIEIWDDGIGADIDVINETLKGVHEAEGYGIHNVNERIRLTYGDAYGLRFMKNEPQGTRAVITIPAVIWGETDHV